MAADVGADGDAAALEARVCALRTSYLSMVPSELAPLRSSTLELSVTEQLLRAQAMLGTCRLREAICALVAADAELDEDEVELVDILCAFNFSYFCYSSSLYRFELRRI